MLKISLIALSFLVHLGVNAQLADGSTAPDFTLADFDGNEHHLYSYLDADKTVFVEIFAAHCPTCWAYHQTNTLKDLYNTYGPNATDELMVLALEHDEGNSQTTLEGEGPDWAIQGNWFDGTPFPLINVEGSDRTVFDDYNVVGYPVVYKICPNRIVERVSTSLSVDALYEKVQACQATLSVAETVDLGTIYFDATSRSLNIDKYQEIRTIHVIGLNGQVVQTIKEVGSPAVAIDALPSGIYLFDIQTDLGSVVQRFYLD